MKVASSDRTSKSYKETLMISYRHAVVEGNNIFYREAGATTAPAILLLHGFPTSSHMFRNLIPTLADSYHVVAPDLPGFGFSDAPDRKRFRYTFENLAKVIGSFTQSIGLQRFAIYVFDYGAPVGLRLALAHPERITALISQNGNAYEEGLSQGWNPIQKYWQEQTPENRAALRDFLKPEAIKRDNPNAEVRFYDTGHFALETHHREIAGAIRDFLGRKLASGASAAQVGS